MWTRTLAFGRIAFLAMSCAALAAAAVVQPTYRESPTATAREKGGGREKGGMIIYVDDSATGANDGTSWNDAFTDLQDALAIAVSGDEVRIAQGTYKPAGPGGDRNTSFMLNAGVTWNGAYAGASAKNPDERDFEIYETVLSGDLNGDDQRGFINTGDNSHHVVSGQSSVGVSVMEGLTIRRGESPDVGAGFISGASNNMHFVRNCTFQDNRATVSGGGADCSSLGSVFESCRFINNHAWQGGGLNTQAAVQGCVFIGNNAGSQGGAIYSSGAAIDGCEFSDNHARKGGAVYVYPFLTPHFISNCTFVNNRTRDEAFAQGGGALATFLNATLSVTNCTFENNSSHGQQGGAILLDRSSVQFTQCEFLNNNHKANPAATYGGAVSILNSGAGPAIEPTFTNCTFTNNAATNPAAGAGGAVYISGPGNNPAFTDCTFTSNDAASGGAVYAIDGAKPVFRDCTFDQNQASYGGGAATVASAGTVPLFRECTFTGNTAASDAGAIFTASSADTHAVNCKFLGNSAVNLAGATLTYQASSRYDNCLFMQNTVTAGVVGAVSAHDASVVVMNNCLVTGNTSANYGAAGASFGSALIMDNCTVAGNSSGSLAGGATAVNTGSRADLRNCIVRGNTCATTTGERAELNFQSGATVELISCAVEDFSGSYFVNVGGNSGVNPLFLDLDGPDNILGTPDDNVRNERRSLCIDFANPNYFYLDDLDVDDDGDTAEMIPWDIYGQPRVVNCLDIGAAEYDGVDMTLLPVGCDGSSTTACFQGIGGGATGSQTLEALSGEGLMVVGSEQKPGPTGYMRPAALTYSGKLNPLEPYPLLSGYAADVSGDGRVVVGESGPVAVRWSCDGPLVLGFLPNLTSHSWAAGVSGDGQVVVGGSESYQTASSEAFRWTQATGMQGIGALDGTNSSFATCVSADGQFIAGRSKHGGGPGVLAFRWSQALGMESLGELPGGEPESTARAISADGSTVVGESISGFGQFPNPAYQYQAFRWTPTTGMIALGDLVGGVVNSKANGVSSAGSVIVGHGVATGSSEATIWFNDGHISRIKELLINKFGLNDSLQGWTLYSAMGVSADGLTFAGVGRNPSNLTERWIAHIPYIPTPCAADVDGTWYVDTDDLLTLLGSWGNCSAGCGIGCPGDIFPIGVGDCTVNTDDLLTLLGGWGPCP